MNINNSVKFSKAIYNEANILRAIQDYRDICRIELDENSDEFICSFFDCKVELLLTVYEFANYLIELSNSRSEET